MVVKAKRRVKANNVPLTTEICTVVGKGDRFYEGGWVKI
jgi:hypothetical protein